MRFVMRWTRCPGAGSGRQVGCSGWRAVAPAGGYAGVIGAGGAAEGGNEYAAAPERSSAIAQTSERTQPSSVHPRNRLRTKIAPVFRLLPVAATIVGRK